MPGLTVDTDLRWTLLSALVAVGAAGDRRDRAPSWTGTRPRPGSGGRRPRGRCGRRAAAKAEAWRLATTDDELPNAINEAIIAGFYHPAQTELTAAVRRSRTSR